VTSAVSMRVQTATTLLKHFDCKPTLQLREWYVTGAMSMRSQCATPPLKQAYATIAQMVRSSCDVGAC